MSTLNVSNISDGTDTVATGYVVNGSAKAWGVCNPAGTAVNVGTFNVSSISDDGTDGKSFSLTSAFNDTPIAALGQEHVARWGNTNGFLTAGAAGISSTLVSVRYNGGSGYIDTYASFTAQGDLA
jgi:hypothetical protein